MKHFLIVIVYIFSIIFIGCNPNNLKSKSLTEQSKEAIIKGRYQDAIDLCKNAIELNPENYVAYNNLGVAMSNLNYDGAEIENCYLKSLKIKGDYDVVLKSLLSHYWKFHNYSEVINYGKKYEQIKPLDSEDLNIIGESYRELKDYTNGEIYFQKSLKIDPNSWATLLNYGELKVDNLKFQDAIILLKKAFQLQSENPVIPRNIGVSYFYLEKFDSAAFYFSETCKIKITKIDLTWKGISLTKAGHLEEGCRDLNNAKEVLVEKGDPEVDQTFLQQTIDQYCLSKSDK